MSRSQVVPCELQHCGRYIQRTLHIMGFIPSDIRCNVREDDIRFAVERSSMFLHQTLDPRLDIEIEEIALNNFYAWNRLDRENIYCDNNSLAFGFPRFPAEGQRVFKVVDIQRVITIHARSQIQQAIPLIFVLPT
jgi:hypothetical protein